MAVVQRKVFQSSTVADGAWFDVSKSEPSAWSIHIRNIETGATVTVEVSNEQGTSGQKEPSQTPPSNPGVTATPTVVANQAIFYPTGYANWVRVRKTIAGGSPTVTTAYLCGIVED
jgi:hypothetical protein